MDPELTARMGLRIRRARLAKGRRQAELADAAGVSQSTISRLELGLGARVPIETWIQVAAAAGLDFTIDLWPTTEPRDALTQERMHRLVVAKALTGGWTAWTVADLTVLERPDRREVALAQVGASSAMSAPLSVISSGRSTWNAPSGARTGA